MDMDYSDQWLKWSGMGDQDNIIVANGTAAGPVKEPTINSAAGEVDLNINNARPAPTVKNRFRKAGDTKRIAVVREIERYIENLRDGESCRLGFENGGWGLLGLPPSITTVTALMLIPWVAIDITNDHKVNINIDRELRAICEGRASRPQLGNLSYDEFYSALRAEIKRRRLANDQARKGRKWNHEGIIKREMVELLDWIEQQLDRIPSGTKSARTHRIVDS
jgi:hypothetical protein